MPTEAWAFWVEAPGRGAVRRIDVPDPGPEEVLVRTCFSAVSRGTERLVFRGAVPARERARMRAPHQEGTLPGPVKYGYLNVGVVERGPASIVGDLVFCLYPHQSAFVVPAQDVIPVPPGVPARRAVLAGTVETAVNAVWDAVPVIGDRVCIVGGGMVGLCVARLLARMPGTEVTVVDVDPRRRPVAAGLGAAFALPDAAPREQDLVFHASATGAGLRLALELLADDASVVDLSWYGTADVTLPLGEAFHTRRLTIRSSQVGTVSPTRARRTSTERLALALRLLDDEAFDGLLTGETSLNALPDDMGRIVMDADGLATLVTYGEPACTR